MSAVCKMWLHSFFFRALYLFLCLHWLRALTIFFHLWNEAAASDVEKNFLLFCVHEPCQYNFITRTQMKKRQKTEFKWYAILQKPWLKRTMKTTTHNTKRTAYSTLYLRLT